MGHEGRCNVHLGGLDGGVGRKLAVSEVRMGERHLCHAIGCSLGLLHFVHYQATISW